VPRLEVAGVDAPAALQRILADFAADSSLVDLSDSRW
jgi:hypothetical protein